ncbi:MAG: thiamine pyrophosphate-dependent enzyme [Firmicutes bacterium]|nr:thiamine pyrophosphate-dependent enzyme [Bacillota bacterium]
MALTFDSVPREDWFTGGHGACPGCGGTIALRQTMKILGPRTVVVIPASCMATVGGSDLTTAWRVPFFHSLFECAPAIASGIRAALDLRGEEGVTVLSWAGDAGTADIGFQSLTGAAERNEDILHICYDNETYMNTGGQAGSLTPVLATTPDTPGGKPTSKKDMPAIMLAHGLPYVATASIGYPLDYMEKVKRAKEIKGFRYIHVLAPCPKGWGIPASKTVEMARLAVQSGLWPLFEVEQGEKKTFQPAERLPVRDYLRGQARFRQLSEKDITTLQAFVDKTREEGH